MNLLCLSNGHGEDEVAVRILTALKQQSLVDRRSFSPLKLAALPLVGTGQAYTRIGIPLISERPVVLPSGGFMASDSRQLWRDLRHGLLGVMREHRVSIKAWLRQGGQVLVVGDIVPLFLAWRSGATYAFVGTAKSDYYLRDEAGPLAQRGFWQRWRRSDYFPWERWLMADSRCTAVFPRDRLTCESLKQKGIRAYDFGNPMMDELASSLKLTDKPLSLLTILLLPGSRTPEAYQNWHLLLTAITGLLHQGPPALFLAAIAPEVEREPLIQSLYGHGWRRWHQAPPLPLPEAETYHRGQSQLMLVQEGFSDCVQLATLAIALAGTATEQVAGWGKPVVTFPGEGPQFTPWFAQRQSQLLGPSVTLVSHPTEVPAAIAALLQDPDRLNLIRENGFRRMGPPGAAAHIAAHLLRVW